MSAKNEFITEAVKWLEAKERSNQEIAEKMYEAVSVTYDMVKERTLLDVHKSAMQELLKVPEL